MTDNQIVQEHPTGVVAAVVTLGVLLLNKFTSVSFDATETGIIIGSLTVIASAFTPRFRRS